jgi:hypothetical protein
MGTKTTKLYCYVDESGQDVRSDSFIVVSIVSSDDQEKLRTKLLEVEKNSGIGQRKWHKSRSPEREFFLASVVEKKVAAGSIYCGRYKKPLAFFSPLLETLSGAIQFAAPEDYRCVIYVDGIDDANAMQLTTELRSRGIKTAMVRTARDESEPMIRLADRWAGCIRASLEGDNENKNLLGRARASDYLQLL